MRLKLASCVLLSMGAMCFHAPSGYATPTPAWAFTSATVSGFDDLVLGYSFTATASEAITEVGWWDATGNGFNSAHIVNIWNNAGALLSSTSLALGTTDALIDGFRFQSIAPIALTAGSTYVISGSTTPADGWAGAGSISGFHVLDPGIAIGPNASVYAYTTNTALEPNAHFGGAEYAGPNFIVGQTDLPEPGTLSVLVFGVAAITALRRHGSRVA